MLVLYGVGSISIRWDSLSRTSKDGQLCYPEGQQDIRLHDSLRRSEISAAIFFVMENCCSIFFFLFEKKTLVLYFRFGLPCPSSTLPSASQLSAPCSPVFFVWSRSPGQFHLSSFPEVSHTNTLVCRLSIAWISWDQGAMRKTCILSRKKKHNQSRIFSLLFAVFYSLGTTTDVSVHIGCA